MIMNDGDVRSNPSWASRGDFENFTLVLAGPSLNDGHRDAVAATLNETPSIDSIEWTDHTGQHSCARFRTNGINASKFWHNIDEVSHQIDVLLIPDSRRKISLLICDMDSTIIPTESLDELAEFMGLGKQVAVITQQAMEGKIDFQQALEQRVSLLAGLEQQKLQACVNETRFNHGARQLLAHARSAGTRTVLVSGGFAPFVEHVATELQFDRWVANGLEIQQGRLTGRVLLPIVDRDTKLKVLSQECARLGIDANGSCCIGDGANDIAMLSAAGCGIAYRAKPIVLKCTPYHLQHADFSVLNHWLDFAAPR